MIPRDQVDLTRAVRRAEVASYDHVAKPAQMEVGFFFTLRSRTLMCWPTIRGKEMLRECIQTFDNDSRETGGNHDDDFQSKEGLSRRM